MRIRLNLNPIHKPRILPRVPRTVSFHFGPLAFIFGGRKKRR